MEGRIGIESVLISDCAWLCYNLATLFESMRCSCTLLLYSCTPWSGRASFDTYSFVSAALHDSRIVGLKGSWILYLQVVTSFSTIDFGWYSSRENFYNGFSFNSRTISRSIFFFVIKPYWNRRGLIYWISFEFLIHGEIIFSSLS